MANHNQATLGLWGLVAVVFGAIIGGGIYNIPQNMALGSALGPVCLSWALTGGGMLVLVFVFRALAHLRPALREGIYQYAQKGFGNYAGFNMAWGGWVCAATGNVALAVMLNDTLGAFFPPLLQHGWPTVLFISLMIWGMFGVICAGFRDASVLNGLLTFIKFASLVVIVAVMAAGLHMGLLDEDVWGSQALQLGDIGRQVRSTMMVTLWCFIGIEGAVVLGARARNHRDVGRAGIIGFLLALLLYAGVSVMSFGILPRSALAALRDPSAAYVLKAAAGGWAYYFVIVSVGASLVGGWLAWTLICVQVPYTAANTGVFPPSFLRTNRRGAPWVTALWSSLIMEGLLMVVIGAEHVYLRAVEITGMLALPPYLFCCLYLGKIGRGSIKILLLAGVGAIFCLWMMYAGGLDLLLMTSVVYLLGIGCYVKARLSLAGKGVPVRSLFTRGEKITALMLLAGAVWAVGWAIWS